MRAETNWSKTLMTSGGRTVKTTLYKDRVQDSYAIWPEKLLKNENCGEGVRRERGEREVTNPELGHVQHDVLVERVCARDVSHERTRAGTSRTEDELGQALVAPGPVDQEQLLEEAKLRDGDVGGARRLQTLHGDGQARVSAGAGGKTFLDARDADPDVCGLDHADVVGAVADGQEDGLLVLLDELDDERLLERRHAA